MTGRASVQLRGAEQAAAQLRTAAREVTDLTDTNRRAAELAARDARRRAPFRTGRLRRSITATATRQAGMVTVGAPYGPPVQARTGFLTRARAATGPAIVGLYRDRLDTITAKANR